MVQLHFLNNSLDQQEFTVIFKELNSKEYYAILFWIKIIWVQVKCILCDYSPYMWSS